MTHAFWIKVGLGALSGWSGGAAVDFHAFQSWKSFQDARQYAWGLALWRWFQGALSGAVAAGGLGAIFGS